MKFCKGVKKVPVTACEARASRGALGWERQWVKVGTRPCVGGTWEGCVPARGESAAALCQGTEFTCVRLQSVSRGRILGSPGAEERLAVQPHGFSFLSWLSHFGTPFSSVRVW